MVDIKQPAPRPVNIERILRPLTKMDLTVAVNNLTGQTDVRPSMILDLTPDRVIVAQTMPPLGKTNLQRSLEASVVHFDRANSEIVRWGWTATVLSLKDDHKLNPDEPASPVVPVISLSHPDDQSQLTESNIRQAYRLDVGRHNGITLAISPMPDPVQLLNFSAGGFMFRTPMPTKFMLNQNLSFNITFPDEAPLPARSLTGRAVIVRLEFGPDEKIAHLGAKFQNLDSKSRLALPKIIHHYMLEEQRLRYYGGL